MINNLLNKSVFIKYGLDKNGRKIKLIISKEKGKIMVWIVRENQNNNMMTVN